MFYNFECLDGVVVTFDNCTFANIASTASRPCALYCPYGEGSLLLINSLFFNLSLVGNQYYSKGTVIYLTFGTYNYNISTNYFLKISSVVPAVVYDGTPSSCPVEYNTFVNISSELWTGVFIIICLFFIVIFYVPCIYR
jgi:hypothetical protein